MKITVILTSYNHEKYLRQSINSVLNQTCQDFEFIIVDDCSTDSSWGIISQYKDEYPEIITIRHEYNWNGGGIADTVKNYATGEYIALHHSDDVWEHDKLQKQVEALKAHPECVAVFSNAMAIDDNGNEYINENGFYYNLFSVENRTRYEWLNYFFYHGNCLCHPSILVKKSVYEEEGFFRKGLKQIPDFVKWIQICKKHEIYVLPEKLVKFRVHNAGKNTSGMRADTQVRSTIELFLMLKEFEAIQDREEFLKIFPEAQKYCMGNFFSTEYVLGRICTEEGRPAYTRLFGVQLLYKVLNDPYKARLLKNEYHYTQKEFKEENGKFDIFGILPKSFEQNRSLYYDSGNGFNPDETITEKFTLGDSEVFHFDYTLSLPEGKKIKGLRFDPVEGVMAKVEIYQVLVNGVQAECLGENMLCQAEGKDIFVNLDPIYIISIPDDCINLEHVEVSISGRVERLADDEIMQAVTSTMYEKLPKSFEQIRSLYYDSGNGFNSDEIITEKFALGDSEVFHFDYTLSLPEGKKIKGLRFDPVEGVMVKVEIYQVLVNGVQAECLGENMLCQEEGKDIFINLDPIYIISIPDDGIDSEHVEVSISGRIERLTDDEIVQAVTSTMYGKLPKSFEQIRSLYYDSGNGFNPDETITEKFTLGDSEIFHFDHTLSLPGGKKLKRLRFDPVEGVMVKVELYQVLVNGIQAECLGENMLCQAEGKDIFVNLDPIYIIPIPDDGINLEHVEVSISGRVERLTDDEIMQTVTSAMYEKRDVISEYQAKIKEQQSEICEVQKQLSEVQKQFRDLQENYNEQNMELHNLKNTRWYKLMVKVDSLIVLLSKEH